MKVINPIGRDIRSGMEGNDGIMPRACKCSVGGSYSVAQTPSDHCMRCGCQCNTSTVQDGNNGSAFWTLRASPDL